MKRFRIIFVLAGFIFIVWLGFLLIPGLKEPTLDGLTMGQWLKALKTNPLDGDNPLALKQIITGEEPDIVTFELPLNYDALNYYALTNVGDLRLWINDKPCSNQGLERATNGNCLLRWNTTYSPPGQHRLQAHVHIHGKIRRLRNLKASGPVLPFFSSNVCQFEQFYSVYGRVHGAMLYARLPDTNATYRIELQTPAGEHIRTISGNTSNGEIEEHWNLLDDNGREYTNDSATAVFRVTLSGSRSGTNLTYLYKATQ